MKNKQKIVTTTTKPETEIPNKYIKTCVGGWNVQIGSKLIDEKLKKVHRSVSRTTLEQHCASFVVPFELEEERICSKFGATNNQIRIKSRFFHKLNQIE